MGAPQGAVLSPLLSNIYLNPLDLLMVSRGFEMVRYADDFVILCKSREEAEQALALARQWCEAEGLTVHPTKTKVVNARTEGFDFLGYHFQATKKGRMTRWPREKSLMKLKDNIRAKTRRSNGNSLECVILDLNRTLKGWYGYFKHCCRQTFRQLDVWVRTRLRNILRNRRKRPGMARGEDHKRYPNSLFKDLGLFNLTMAHDLEGQPTRG
jgi:RNA-directed DNA polymerase